jgi:hypothetical protein
MRIKLVPVTIGAPEPTKDTVGFQCRGRRGRY